MKATFYTCVSMIGCFQSAGTQAVDGRGSDSEGKKAKESNEGGVN